MSENAKVRLASLGIMARECLTARHIASLMTPDSWRFGAVELGKAVLMLSHCVEALIAAEIARVKVELGPAALELERCPREAEHGGMRVQCELPSGHTGEHENDRLRWPQGGRRLVGTDIHLFTEARASSGAPWELERVTWACPCRDVRASEAVLARAGEAVCADCHGSGRVVGYDWRNYTLFRILRETSDALRYSSELALLGYRSLNHRGVPSDASEELLGLLCAPFDAHAWKAATAKYGECDLGDWGRGWLTLAELDGLIDWTAYVSEEPEVSFVTPEVYEEWLRTMLVDAPRERRLQASGRVWTEDRYLAWRERASPEALEGARTGSRPTPKFPDHVQIRLRLTQAQAAGYFYERFLPELRALGAPENVRIIFGFDS